MAGWKLHSIYFISHSTAASAVSFDAVYLDKTKPDKK